MTDNNLPDYERPPVVETILGVQFDPLPGLTNAHLGLFWETLGEEWCHVADVQTIDPQFERFSDSANWGDLGVQLKLTQDPASRLQIRNRDNNRMIQVQNGRLHFNWLRQGEEPYPCYQSVLDGFLSAIRSFVDFLRQQEIGDFHPNQWEVTYINHIPQNTVWNAPTDWRFFLPLSQSPDLCIPLESFGGEWHYVIPPERGRLHVQWRHGRRKTPAPPGIVVVLTLTSRGPLNTEGFDIDVIREGLGLGRKVIVRAFRELMSDDANSYWGLKHDCSGTCTD